MAEENIKTVKSFKLIPFKKLVSKDTLVLFDLDDTTFIEKIAIMRNINYDKRKKFVESIRSIAGNERVTFLYDNLEYQLVENCIREKLATPGLQCIGFTARRTGKATSDQLSIIEDKTLAILSNLNINFKSDIIKEIILVLFDEEDYEIYKRVLGNGMKTDLNEIIMD